MAVAYLILGSNIGNRFENLKAAIKLVNKHTGKITGQSSVYESEPWGFESTTSFMNQVIRIITHLNPELLLDQLIKTEEKLGRKRSNLKGYESRIIDIDILFYDDKVINTVNLIIPHPRLHLRNFVLEPLAELIPDFIHPLMKKSMAELKDNCKDTAWVKKMN